MLSLNLLKQKFREKNISKEIHFSNFLIVQMFRVPNLGVNCYFLRPLSWHNIIHSVKKCHIIENCSHFKN